MSALETELALLREENAQLKVERHRPADTGHVIERMRSLRLQKAAEPRAAEGSVSAAEAQAIAESVIVREGLMEACQEVQQAMRGIRGRLGALAGDIHSRPGEPAKAGQLAASTVEAVGIEPVLAAEPSPELVQSVA
ncbi:MAG: hypothetical protein WAN93_03350 [Solirubrobacteraceae bacterium]